MASTVVAEGEEESGRVVGTRAALSAFIDVVAKMDLVGVSARLGQRTDTQKRATYYVVLAVFPRSVSVGIEIPIG